MGFVTDVDVGLELKSTARSHTLLAPRLIVCLADHPVKQSRRQFQCGACTKPFRILPSFFTGLINIKDVALLLRINK